MPYRHLGYVGGIAGYNNGSILTDKRQEVISIVTGGDYTGGLIGYNASQAEVRLEQYILKGGYIEGRTFVGGLIGCNTSSQLFKQSEEELADYSLQSNPNYVYGISFVGGCIGGNLVPTDKDLYIQCNTANSFASVTTINEGKPLRQSGGCVGGFIGYNCLFSPETTPAALENYITDLSSGINNAWGNWQPNTVSPDHEASKPGDNDEESPAEGPPAAEVLVEKLLKNENGNVNKTAALHIADTSGNGSYGNTMNEVSGGIMVGGLVGHNDKSSLLEIKNVVNEAAVTSVFYVASEDRTCLKAENGSYLPAKITYNTETKVYSSADGESVCYSYTGGIIGMASETVTIDNCSNSGVLTVAEETTYKGSIAEINEGIIKNCEAKSFGDTFSKYLGGITGCNKLQGKIYNCSLTGTITGNAAIGGIAAENYGLITYSQGKDTQEKAILKGRLNVASVCAGGVSGFNAGTISQIQLNTPIDGTASYVGGIAGINYGSLTNFEIAGDNKLSINGRAYVGGCAGYMRNITGNELIIGGTQETPLNIACTVIASGLTQNNETIGNAGGVVGYIDGENITVQYCRITGPVSALSGSAGGITSYNRSGKIISCTVNSDIKAPNGMCGGIAAVNQNDSQIIGCGIANASGAAVQLQGSTYTGGIAAKNAGRITSCFVASGEGKLTLNNTSSASGDSAIGGITGINEQTGSIGTENGQFACWVGRAPDPDKDFLNINADSLSVQITSDFSGSRLGGIAGENFGSIYGGKDENGNTKYTSAHVFVNNESITGWLGGAAGINSGTIQNIQCLSRIKGEYGSEGGFGGIAGENSSVISGCDFSGKLSGKGSAADIVSIGGIAGKNTSNGEIVKCTIASSSNTEITTQESNNKSCSYIGGIAGRNDGRISEIFCNATRPDSNNTEATGYNNAHTVKVTASLGNVGGMVGYQSASGSLNNSINNDKWSVSASAYYSDTAIGGMIGYSASDKDMYYLTNYANVSRVVTNSNSAGGIAGRLESMNSNTKKVSHCINYGSVSEQARVGGIIGQWKYMGGEIEYCENYGKIVQKDSGGVGAGGIMGVLFQFNDGNTLRFNECINYSTVSGGSNCAGILGNNRRSSGKTTIQFTQCVNIGSIGSGGAGIYARQSDSDASVQLLSCRNYGYSETSGGEISGIFGSKEVGTVTMKDCYGVSEVEPRLTSVALTPESQNNYYFEEHTSTSGDMAYMNLSLMHGTCQGSSTLDKAIDYNPSTRFTAITDYTSPVKDPDKRLNITVDFIDYWGDPISLSSKYMQITWYGDNRNYYFKLFVKYEGEDEYTCLEPLNPYILNGESFWVGNSTGTTNITKLPSADDNVTINFSDSKSGWYDDKRIISLKLEYYSNTGTSTQQGYCTFWDMYIDGTTVTKYIPTTISKLYVKGPDSNNKFCADLIDNAYSSYIKELSENPCNWAESPKKLYESIDMQLKTSSSQRKKLTAPDPVNIAQNDNKYRLSWKDVPGALKYLISIRLYNTEDSLDAIEDMGLEITTPSINYVDIPIDSSWSGKYMRASVTALNILSTEAENYDSDAAVSNTVKVLDALPTPEAHLEKHCEQGEAYYILCVDNIEDYLGYSCSFIAYKNNDKLINPIPLEDINSETGEGNTKIRTLLEPESDENISLQFQAITNTGQYLNSPKIAVQTSLPLDSNLRSDSYANIKMKTNEVPNFTGTSPENLGFTNVLKTSKDSAYYYKSELLMFDEVAGMEVAVSTTETFISSYAGEVTATLGDISPKMAASLLKQENPKLTARTYLWATQGHSVYFGSKLPVNGNTPLKAEELIQKYPELFTPRPDDKSNVSEPIRYDVKDGYTVERVSIDNDNQDPVYNIYYSTFLAEKVYNKQAVSITAELKDNRVAAPVLKTDYTIINNRLHFGWDIDETIPKDSMPSGYNVTITGITTDKRRVELLSSLGQTDKYIDLPMENWNYKEVEVAVTSLGTTKNNIVSRFFNYSSKVYRTYLPLPQITMPRVKLHDNNQDELSYDISWNAITEEAPRKDLQEYQVYVLAPLSDTSGNKIDPEALKSAFGSENIFPYPNTEDSETQTGWKILLGSKAKEAPPGEEDSYTENVLENCSLEALQGCRVRFFVNAAAISHEGSDAENILYTDSEEGVMTNEILIPKRLLLADDLSFSLTYGDNKSDEVRTEEEFLSLIMNCTVTSNNAKGDGAYKFEAGIYPEKQDELIIVEQTEDGLFKVSEDACENGSLLIAPLVPKDKVLTTTPVGNLRNTTLSLKAEELSGWNQDLAGQYLIIRCRVSDSSNISSVWSEYQVYRLPSSKLAAPAVSEGTTDFVKGDYEGTQYQLRWTSASHASGYRLQLENLRNETVTAAINYMEDGTPEITVDNKKLSPVKTENSYTYALTDFAYSAEWPWESGSSQQMDTVLTITVHEKTDHSYSYDFVLKLPDVNDLEAEQNKIYHYLYTSGVNITALAEPDSAYQDSDNAAWLRVVNKNDVNSRKTTILIWNGTEDLNKLIQAQDGLEDYIRYETKSSLPEIISSGTNKTVSVSQNSVPQHGQVSGNTVSNNSAPSKQEKPDSETGTESESKTESGTETETESKTESETETETESKTESGTEAEIESKTGPETESKSSASTESAAKSAGSPDEGTYTSHEKQE